MGKIIDLTGKLFGRLTVISFYKRQDNKTIWNCECSCGKKHKVASSILLSGKSKSCGCLMKELARNQLKIYNTKHGMYGTKEYRAWRAMINRCTNPNTRHYDLYGGLGINVDDEFISSFENFIKEVGMVPEPKNQYSLDRIDNTKGYIKGNLRWATTEQQNRNRSKLKNNSSGFTGVVWHFDKRRNRTNVMVNWRETVGSDSIKFSKYFPVIKYGLLPAFAEACKFREFKIKQLNERGYEYSNNHGISKIKE